MDFAAFVLVLSVLFLFGSFWALHQNNETFNDRTKIIRIVFRQADWDILHKCLDEVTYESHLWTRIMLRDWRKLYPESIQKLL